MYLTSETTVPSAALPIAAFKDHLRLGTGFSSDDVQDALLEEFLRAAIGAVEARTGKVLFSRGFTYAADEWRAGDEQVLPVAPVSAIDALVMVTADGTETVIAPEIYRLRADTHRPSLRAHGMGLPTIPHQGEARIAFTAGFGVVWSDLPSDLRQAVLLLGAHYYEYRHETALPEGCMPFGVTSLIERYRTLRLTMGSRA